jgi:hypothetical protein
MVDVLTGAVPGGQDAVDALHPSTTTPSLFEAALCFRQLVLEWRRRRPALLL